MQKATATTEARDETATLVAGNLRDYMKDKRWTGRSFAMALGLQPVYVQRRMSGEVELSASDLSVFAHRLEIKVQDFFNDRTKDYGSHGTVISLDSRRHRTAQSTREHDAIITPFPA